MDISDGHHWRNVGGNLGCFGYENRMKEKYMINRTRRLGE